MQTEDDSLKGIEDLFLITIGAGSTSVGLVSPEPRSGVTTIANALALRCAKAHLETVVLDMVGRADEGTPKSDWLPGDGSAMRRVVRDPKGFDRLVLNPPPSARELVNRVDRLKDMISRELSSYRAVIVDVPPILSDICHVTGLAGASCCDVVVLVCATGKVTCDAMVTAHQRLERVGIFPRGVVMADFHTPTLGAELVREASRLDRRFPALANLIKRKVKSSAFLNKRA
jgi:Mrp family chromosome partitioning ATPase